MAQCRDGTFEHFIERLDEMFNFSKNKELETLDKVPDNIKPFYTRSDAEDDTSPFVLKKDEVVSAAVNIITGAAGALEKERNKKAVDPVDLTPLSAYGTDVEGIVTAVNKQKDDLEKQIKGDSNVKEQINDLRREMSTAHATETNALKTENGNLVHQLDEYMIQTEIDAAAAVVGANPKLIAPFAKVHMKVNVDENSRRSVVIINLDGTDRYSMENAGDLANGVELLQDMQKDAQYKALFPPSQKSGAGSEPGPGRKPAGKKGAENMTAASKIAQGLGDLK
ncbi:MAG: hypothetical protein JRC86_00735 [Deltaproteobacteria bacterium]|nr:hypothetical protein [Deltaproteobacteria bacterium]